MKDKITKFLIEHGAGQVGFCKLKEKTEGFGYAISYTIPLSDAIIDTITDAPTHTYFHHYRTVNALIDHLSLRVGFMLAEKGYRYIPVPASQSINGLKGLFSHKTAATLSGLGAIGKSGLFISTKNGPRVRLGTILTNYPFKTEPFEPVDPCGDCKLCALSCPAMAITGESWSPYSPLSKILDAKACSDYMKKEFQHIGRGVVCGICMKVCPKGRPCE